MIKRLFIVILVVAGFIHPLCAEIVVNDDNTVEFTYRGPGKHVYVVSDLYYTDQDSSKYTDRTRRIKMHLQSDGKWHATTQPVQPELYTYCFKVNGKRISDPYNNDTAWQKMHKWNIVHIPDFLHTDLYGTPKQQGKLIRTCWYSSAEKICRRVNIYLPAEYNENTTYPVLYLIHGINGYEGSWSERGRAIQIMENTVVQGKCAPMILVMPDVNFGVHEDRPSHHTLWNNVFNYPRLCHDHNIEKALVELITQVDSTYRTSADRYIAGFSDGARIAANTANLMPDYFKSVGLFSPVVHKDQLPQDSALYSVYTGKKDMFHSNAKRFYKRLAKQSTAHRYIETTGGHTWRNWRLYLADFIRSL